MAEGAQESVQSIRVRLLRQPPLTSCRRVSAAVTVVLLLRRGGGLRGWLSFPRMRLLQLLQRRLLQLQAT